MQSREIRLRQRPVGMPTADDFETATVDVADPADGEVTVRNVVMSVDPYMRGRMMDRKSYVPPFQIGEALTGGVIGRVVASKADGFAEGDYVQSMYGWREGFTAPAAELQSLGSLEAPPSAYLGVLGMPGMTAYAGLLEVGALQQGETVYVSGAAGAVGSVVGQIAKIKNCRVLGSAGSAEKVEWLREIPGGVGDFLAPVLAVTPGILFILIGALPMTRVRARRREIVQSVDQDLPMTLALMATLVESGLGFDAAIDRILSSLDPDRPLARELELFRSESRAGVPRFACFRSLAQRLDVVSVSTFVSAMVHSEQVGGGVAESLRRQADEVWNRRRELAIQRAQTLPTKLAVPLVICFLPGIFIYTFGPALAEFLRIADNVVSGSN